MSSDTEKQLIGRLDEKRRRLELALEAGRLGPWDWDIRTGVVTWSPAVEAMHGLPPGSFTGTFEAYQQDLHPDDRERVLAEIQQNVAAKRDHFVEYRIVRPDGTVRWLRAHGRFVLDDQGEPVRLVGVCGDVTEEKEAALALTRSEAFYAATLMSVGDAVIATDATARVLLMNSVAEQLTGWTGAEAAGRPLDEVFRIINESTRQLVESPVVKALREGEVVGLANHTILIRKDGSEISIDDSAAPIVGRDGVTTGVVLVFRDVTETRQEEIRRSFMATAIAALGASLDYRTTLANVARAAVPHVVDWCAVDVLGEGGGLERLAVAHVDPDKVALAEEIHRRYPTDPSTGPVAEVLATARPVLVGDIPDEMLVALARDDEHLRIARELGLGSFLVVPLRAAGRTIGVISLVNSRTSRALDDHDVQLAEELSHAAARAIENARLYEAEQRARQEAERAVERREDLLAIVSHDLRNPLGTILTAAELLARDPALGDAGSRSRRPVEAITRAAQRMNRLIADLLDLSSLERGQLRIEPRVHDAAAILEETVQLHVPLAAEKKVQLVAAARDPAWVLADRERLGQILSNLIGNAIKFTPEGGRIEVSLARDGGVVRFAVADTGCGIASEQLPHVFDRYWRGRGEGQSGVGLGLSIVKGLVEAQGGQVGVRSRPGEGTTVEFTVPAADAPST